MKIRLHAQETADGIVLSQISTEDTAESVHAYFREMGIADDGILQLGPGNFRSTLLGTSLEVFNRLVQGANIELI